MVKKREKEVLKLNQKQEIVISHLREGKSLRKIVMETGISGC